MFGLDSIAPLDGELFAEEFKLPVTRLATQFQLIGIQPSSNFDDLIKNIIRVRVEFNNSIYQFLHKNFTLTQFIQNQVLFRKTSLDYMHRWFIAILKISVW